MKNAMNAIEEVNTDRPLKTSSEVTGVDSAAKEGASWVAPAARATSNTCATWEALWSLRGIDTHAQRRRAVTRETTGTKPGVAERAKKARMGHTERNVVVGCATTMPRISLLILEAIVLQSSRTSGEYDG